MRKKKNFLQFVFKNIVRVECWSKKEEILFYFLILYSTRHLQLSVDVKRRKYFHSQLNIWQLPFPIWSKENLLFHSWQKRHCMGSQGVKRKSDFFITNLTNKRLLYRYEVKKVLSIGYAFALFQRGIQEGRFSSFVFFDN